jgi:hypothetical protein
MLLVRITFHKLSIRGVKIDQSASASGEPNRLISASPPQDNSFQDRFSDTLESVQEMSMSASLKPTIIYKEKAGYTP